MQLIRSWIAILCLGNTLALGADNLTYSECPSAFARFIGRPFSSLHPKPKPEPLERLAYQVSDGPVRLKDGALIEIPDKLSRIRLRSNEEPWKSFSEAGARLREEIKGAPNAERQLELLSAAVTATTGKLKPMDPGQLQVGIHLLMNEAGLSPFIATARATETGASKIVHLISLNGKNFRIDAESQVKTYPMRSQADPWLESGSTWKIERSEGPRAWVPSGAAKAEQITVQSSKGPIQFRITGRSAADRRFREEQAQFEAANLDDLVPLEWHYFPYYVPWGHSAIRVGNRLFEYTRGGWRIHGDSKDSPRAFLMNNPFFHAQYMRLKETGMPPYSVGVTMKMPKRDVQEILSWIENYQANPPATFAFLWNNCNQCLLDAFEAGTGKPTAKAIASNSYRKFSSILTFNKMLNGNPYPIQSRDIYPIAGLPEQNESYLELFPSYLDGTHSSVDEVRRTFQNLPVWFENHPTLVKPE